MIKNGLWGLNNVNFRHQNMLSRATLSITKQPIVAKQRLIIPPLLLFNRTTSSTATTLLSIPPHTSTDQTNQTIHFTNTDTQHCHLSFSNLFSLLKCPPNLSEARRLHSLLLVGGFFTTNRVLGSQLANVYVELGSFEEALLVFHKLPQKNNIAWNAILRGFLQVAQFSEAIEFYHLMLRQGIVPDNFTYPLILKACSGICALEEGKRVLELIRFNETSRGIKPNIYVECAMVDMFSKCGSLDEARMVFEEMPRKDLASWTAMICGTVQNGDWIGAFCLFRRMKLEGIRPDSLIVSGLLPACGRLEARKVGMGLQGCAVRSGFDSDLFVSNALMDMYCKCGKTREAYCVFCSMEYKDAVSWSTLIAGYSQNSQYRESVELYLEMKSNGVKTNAVSAASVLPGFAKLRMLKKGKEMHNYILKQGFESDIVVASALVDMYVNCHSTREAQHIFEIMSDRDITIWNSMIAGHAFSENFDLSFRIFRRIWESKLEPNSITLVSILPICTEVGSLKHGKEIHGYATRSGLGMVVTVGNSLIDMYCKNGCLELGVKVFNMMTVKNVVTYNTIISAHGIHGQGERALSFFDQMKAAKVRPNRVTFIGLLSACSHAGLIDRGWFFYNSMIDDYDLMPDMEHYSCMVDLLGRAGHLGDACNFISGMSVEPDINVLGSLLAACRVHNKVELADFVGRQIFKKNSKDSGYHVLLANIYASTDRWEDVSKLRTMIKEKGLIKKPGKSWIDLGGCIHIFHARGTKHPEFSKIQETLESLLLEMTNERV